ncbi:MAG: hypothetical protein IT561_22555 [Alphaproteobacteria bacterium]|nr:hypothetical protein [Alphaproteobacteria bacterium]
MRLALPPAIVRKLTLLPETGMGHQRVDLLLRDGRAIGGVAVLNAEIATVPDGAGAIEPADVIDVRLSAPLPRQRP